MAYNGPSKAHLEESPLLLKITDFSWMKWESDHKHALMSKAWLAFIGYGTCTKTLGWWDDFQNSPLLLLICGSNELEP